MTTGTFSPRISRSMLAVFVTAAFFVGGFFAPNASATISSLNLTAPSGGEFWRASQTVTWTGSSDNPAVDTVDIVYAADGINFNTLIASGRPFSDGSYVWDTTLPIFAESETARVGISPGGFPILSDTSGMFTVDNTPPVVTPPGDVNTEATAPLSVVAIGSATATDNFDASPAITNDAPASFPVGTTVVTWSATDDSGNVGTAIQNVTVTDTTPPSITPPADETFEATGPTTSPTLTPATATDIADPAPVVTYDPTSFIIGVHTVTWTATDASGNSATTTSQVTIEDTTAPVIDPHGDESAEATSPAGAVVTYTEPNAVDLVDGTFLASCLPASGDTFPLGATTVTCDAMDTAGNPAVSTNFTVTVVDTTAPVIDPHGDESAEATSPAGAVVTYTEPNAVDLVDGIVAVSCIPAPGSTFVLGDTLVTCSATDSQGNTGNSSFTVHITDTTPPSITPPADETFEATGPTTSPTLTPATATDIADPAPVVTYDPTSFIIGVHTVTWTATDASGNSATTTSQVTIEDTTAPTVAAPVDVTVEAAGPLTAPPLGSPIVIDIADPAPVVTNDAPAGFPVGTTVVTWTATDASGNSATDTQSVTVTDTTPPVVADNSDMLEEATSALGAIVSFVSPVATDLVDGVVAVSCTPSSGSQFPLGTTTVTCSATDSEGNTGSSMFDVTVQDTTAPVIDPHSDEARVADSLGGATVTYIAPLWTDAVDGSGSASCAPAPGTFFVLGDTTVTCTQTDTAGNAAAPVMFVVTVVPDAISQLEVSANPLLLVVGDSSVVTVTGKDQFGNVVTNNSSTIVVLNADNGGSLTTTLVTLLNGENSDAELSTATAGDVHVNASSGVLIPGQATVTFTAAPVTDTTPPVISDIHTGTINQTSTTANWDTDEISDSQVEYGLTSSYGSTTVLSVTLVTGHTKTLSGLTPGTLYHYRVKSRDAAGNLAVSGDNVFTTASATPDTTAPAVPVFTTVSAGTDADTYPIAGTAADDGGARTVRLYNGAILVGTLSLPAGETTWAFTASLEQDAANTFTATSADEVGNMSAESAPITITEATATGDTEAPPAPEINTADAAVDADTYTLIGTAGADIPTDGTRVITISRDGTVVGSLSLLTGDTDWSFVAPLEQNADNTFTANSTDSSGNTSPTSAEVVITEATATDSTSPIITNIQVTSISSVSATVTWTTDEASDSQVEYGPTSGYGSPTALDATPATSHSVNLSGLIPDITYHFRVKSADAAANLATSGDQTFDTAPASNPPVVPGVTNITAVKTFAIAGGDYANGWEWVFDVTLPVTESSVSMKFADWVSGTNTIPAAANIRFFSAQASDANAEGTAVTIGAANVYSGPMNLTGDVDLSRVGRQVQIHVQARVPGGSAAGSYSTSYGIKSTTP